MRKHGGEQCSLARVAFTITASILRNQNVGIFRYAKFFPKATKIFLPVHRMPSAAFEDYAFRDEERWVGGTALIGH